MELAIERVRDQRREPARDWLAVESALEIQLDHPELAAPCTVAVTLRTPGHDVELALGYLYAEGVLSHQTHCVGARGGGAHLRLELAGAPPDLGRLARSGAVHAGCGACGKLSLEALLGGGEPAPLVSAAVVADEVLRGLPASLRAAQATFAQTGGLHAVGRFDLAGNLLALREDVGRHNALDKLVGAALRAGELPFSDQVLLLSGRASFELLQKAWRAGAALVAAIGAPSSLAVEMAERAGITLIGFLRADGYNLYTRAERVGPPTPR
jgi:FdhD protein